MKILLACQTATNKGDRAIAEFVIDRLTEQGHEVVLSTTRPELWLGLKNTSLRIIRMGYKSLQQKAKHSFTRKILGALNRCTVDKILFADLISPKGKHRICQIVSKKFISEIQTADLVVVTGGHHITSIREKNALFQFTYDIGLISLYAKRYVLWSQTIGPLQFTSDKARKFVGDIIRKAETVYIRDDNSRTCVEELYGQLDNIAKTYDSVFGYGNEVFPEISAREKKVGVAIFDGLKKSFKTFDVLAQMLDDYASAGYAIEFFRMEHNDFELENIHRIIALMKHKTQIKIHPFMTTTKDHLLEVASCRFFIGYKTHSVIMALTTATPLIAIAYHKKTFDFMRDYGLAAYAVPDEELDFAKAKACMVSLADNLQQVHQTEKNISLQIAEQMKKDIFEMVHNEK